MRVNHERRSRFCSPAVDARVARRSRANLCRRALGVALLVAISLALPPRATAGEEASWERVHEEDGIAVERWRASAAGRPHLRTTTVIDAGIEVVSSVLRDVERHPEWRNRCTEARVLQREGDDKLVVYSRTEGRWPVADRDSVFESEVVRREPERVEIHFRNVESLLMPPVPGVVRMPSVYGYYRLEALDAGRTRVEYELEMDMGGRIPSFVTHYVSDEMPFHTLKGLKEQVKRVAEEDRATGSEFRRVASNAQAPQPRSASGPSSIHTNGKHD